MKQSIPFQGNLKQQFEEDGYLKINGFFSESDCDALRIRILEIIARHDDGHRSVFKTDKLDHTSDAYFLDSGDKIRVFYEKDFANHLSKEGIGRARLINKVGHALHDLDPVFDKFSRAKKLEYLCLALGIERALILQSMYIFKQPFIGGEVNCHQDGSFIYCEPDSMIGLWVALENATIENGCLWAIPQGHKGPLRTRFVREGYQTRFLELDSTPFDEHNMRPLEIKKGGLIVLHSKLPHMSRTNKSEKSRHAYVLHVMDSKSIYAKDNWLQRSTDFPFSDFDNLAP